MAFNKLDEEFAQMPDETQVQEQPQKPEYDVNAYNDLLEQYRQKLQKQPEENTQALKDARDRQEELGGYAMLNTALGGIGKAVTAGYGGKSTIDTSELNKQLETTGRQGVEQAKEDKKNAEDKYLQQIGLLKNTVESYRQQKGDIKSDQEFDLKQKQIQQNMGLAQQEAQRADQYLKTNQQYVTMAKQREALSNEKTKESLKLFQESTDPNSQVSQNRAAIASKLFPEYKDSFVGRPAHEIDELMKTVGSQVNKQIVNKYKQEVADQKQEDKINRETQKLSDKLGNTQDLTNVVKGIETSIGFDLDSYDPKTGKVKGKKIDIPGVSLPGVGRVSFFSDEARPIQAQIQKVFNVELKDRSGAAVTTPELERLKSEFAAGKFNTESELLGALKSYKSELKTIFKNREAGVSPQALKAYEQRGGMTSNNAFEVPKLAIDNSQINSAKKFVQDNPNDPRSAVIMQRLKSMGEM